MSWRLCGSSDSSRRWGARFAVDRVRDVHQSRFRVADAFPARTDQCARRAQEESFEAMVR